MTTTPLKLYQVGTFAAGNRLLIRAERTVQSSTDRASSHHLGPSRMPRLRRGARGPGGDGRRDAGDRRPPGHRQRHGVPRGLLDPLPRVRLAGAVAALLVRQRRGRGVGRRRGDAGHRSRRRPRPCPGRRRRHRRHRPRLPLGHVRAQRRRALRLLRQPGLHEHRRAALRGDAGRRQHRQHPAGRRRASATRSAPARTCRASPWPTRSRTSPRPRWPTCTTSRPRSAQRCRCTARATSTSWCRARSGWGSAASDTVRVARLATQSGLFPVFEAEHGTVTRATPIRRRVPVEEYLRLQTRFQHLFAGAGRPDVVAALQAQADRDIARFGLRPRGGVMKLPFAVTSGPRLQPRRPHRCLAHRARRLRAADGTLRQRVPRRARTCGRGCTTPRAAARATSRPGAASWRPTRSRPSAAGSATTRARPPATVATSTRRSASTPSSASSATRRWPKAGASRSPPRPPGGGCSSSAPGRPDSPRRTTWPGAGTRSPSGSPHRSPAG